MNEGLALVLVLGLSLAGLALVWVGWEMLRWAVRSLLDRQQERRDMER